MVRKNNPSSSLGMFYIYPLVFPRGQTYSFLKRILIFCLLLFVSPHVRQSNTVLDSTGIPGTRDSSHFHCIFSILDSNL